MKNFTPGDIVEARKTPGNIGQIYSARNPELYLALLSANVKVTFVDVDKNKLWAEVLHPDYGLCLIAMFNLHHL